MELPTEIRQQVNAITQKAIEKGYDRAQAEWREMALGVVYAWCVRNPTITSNDVSEKIINALTKTHDNRAIGGIFKTAKSLGWLTATGETIESVAGHLTRLQIWRSKIYKPGTPPEAEAPTAALAPSASHYGKNYTVFQKKGEYRCTCPGFKYRNTCRHIEEEKMRGSQGTLI